MEACRYGDADVEISIQAVLAARFAGLFPNLTVRLSALAALVLPGPTGAEGDEARTGSQSESAFAPSILTEPTYQAAAENNQLPRAASEA